ncbi:hypothetical protein QVD17_03064 [Tagetes erecta]|uniref:F-box domain-containing protein n=1 Tax=Tagetes erecta TaxID=13708 RepID=A0AAD8LAM3_TARER|nr:hypothetical protein QVD17_03064 [Tagetes erecta]
MLYDHLSEDLFADIFTRLPPKSLLRFQSLSKSSYARIRSRDFIRLHTLRSPNKFIIIHRVKLEEEASSKSIYTIHSEGQLSSYAGITPIDYPLNPFNVVGTCNGIVFVYESYGDAIHLWNPSIRRKETIHELPSTSPTIHGFGFDPVLDDYKILRISKEGTTFVYTMKTRTWREIASPTSQLSDHTPSSQCLFNGALHWVVWCLDHHPCYSYYKYILRFDLSSEVFSTIELPDPRETIAVTVIKGCLSVISLNDNVDDCRIWMRNIAATATATVTATATWSVFLKLNTQAHVTHGDLLFSHDSEGIIVFNPETKTRFKLVRFTDSKSSYIVNMTTCVESLGLLGVETTCDETSGKK